MKYARQLGKVTDFIGKNLDEELSLEKLSEIACFSKYHFHRLFTVFTVFTGLSLQQYIRWLRLKRAAHQLMIEKDKSIINIAIDAGFESHEVFTRAFKKICGMTPSEFKKHATWLL